MITFNLFKILFFVVVDFFLGFIWHSEKLFAKPWMEATGLTKEKIEKRMENTNMMSLFLSQIVLNIISLLVHTYVMISVNPKTLCESLTMSFLLWLGFSAGPAFGPILWEGRPINYFLITSGYKLTSMMIFSFGYFTMSQF
jgi:hypothetical protein